MATDYQLTTTDPGDSGPTRDIDVVRVDTEATGSRPDCVAVEEPLEIRLAYHFLNRRARRSVAVTMRTPGCDRELAAGFLYGEGILSHRADIDGFQRIDDDGEPTDAPGNIVQISVGPGVDVDMKSIQRNFYTTSSCGVCGKASLQALEIDDGTDLTDDDTTFDAHTIAELPDRLRDGQSIFEATGGIHAAGLFDDDGRLLDLCEDVGRHNAMDKLVGTRLWAEELPATGCAAVLSGRASFELLQKALRARIPVVVAVGAPSSLAVDLAHHFGITLVGFARRNRFNIYSHQSRIIS